MTVWESPIRKIGCEKLKSGCGGGCRVFDHPPSKVVTVGEAQRLNPSGSVEARFIITCGMTSILFADSIAGEANRYAFLRHSRGIGFGNNEADRDLHDQSE